MQQQGDADALVERIFAAHLQRGEKVGSLDELVINQISLRVGSLAELRQRYALIKREAERYLHRALRGYKDFILTIKNSTLIPSAGIDESNGNGYYILWPQRITSLLKELQVYLKKRYKLKNLAVVATDSHTTPLRYGVIGISIGFCGLEPLYDYRGRPDIFGRKLKYTKTNVIDSLSAMAVLLMGEGNEMVPMVILRGAKFVRFTNKDAHRKLFIPPHKDLYAPLLRVFQNKK